MATLFATLLAGPTVMAQSAPPDAASAADLPRAVRLVVPACRETPFDVGGLLEILEVELGQSGVALEQDEPEPRETTALVIVDAPSCRGDAIVLRVERPGSNRSVTRELTLSDTPLPERARVMALSIAELIRAAWSELVREEPAGHEEGPPPPAPPAPLPPDQVRRGELEALRAELSERLAALERARSEDEAPAARFELLLAGGVRLFPSYGGTFAGARFGGSFRLGRREILRLDVEAELRYGRTRDALGTARAYVPMGWAALLASGRSGRSELALGLGFGVGWAWAGGDALDSSAVGRTMSGVVVAAAFRGLVERQMSQRLSLLLIVEAGYVIVGVTPLAAGDPIVGVAGPFVTIDLGLSFAL